MPPSAKPDIRTAQQILDDEFLTVRAKILELAAALDRIQRGTDPRANVEQMRVLQSALDALMLPNGDRAEQVQLIFSRPYADDWRNNLEV